MHTTDLDESKLDFKPAEKENLNKNVTLKKENKKAKKDIDVEKSS